MSFLIGLGIAKWQIGLFIAGVVFCAANSKQSDKSTEVDRSTDVQNVHVQLEMSPYERVKLTECLRDR